MTEPRDEIGDWLDEPVEPLPPPPGTYQRIKARAARRRRNQAMAAAASAITVIAFLVAVPRLAVTAIQSGRGSDTAENTATLPRSSVTASDHNKLPTGPKVLGTGRPLPNGFAPISATFIGLRTGWVLGTRAGHCLASRTGGPAGCLALARTDDTGARWYSVPGLTGADVGGVSQVRFLNLHDGWLFGPGLWWTADGGNSWQQARTDGQRVISLEAVGDRAFAVFATCGGAPSPAPGGLSAGCSSYRLYSATAGTAGWRLVPGATSGSGSASVVLTQDTGFLVAASGTAVTVASGPVTGDGAWQAVASPCEATQGASPSAGTKTSVQVGATVRRALLAAASGSLFAVCSTGTAGTVNPPKEVLTSGDGGHSWNRRNVVPIPGTAWSAAVSPGGGVFVVAASTGLYVSRDGGATWRLALTGPPGGFGYVGMTDVLQGFAIPAGGGQYGMSLTTDGGQNWVTLARSP
ncbi:MAG: hypothetical protein ACM3ML_15175 [Micromonosporaceae bacterium]